MRWQWEMDGDGMGVKGKGSATYCRERAAAANGDVWKDMTANYHFFPDCLHTSLDATLEAMRTDVYSCEACVSRMNGVNLWSDFLGEGGLGGLDWDACGNLRPTRELTRQGVWYYYWSD